LSPSASQAVVQTTLDPLKLPARTPAGNGGLAGAAEDHGTSRAQSLREASAASPGRLGGSACGGLRVLSVDRNVTEHHEQNPAGGPKGRTSRVHLDKRNYSSTGRGSPVRAAAVAWSGFFARFPPTEAGGRGNGREDEKARHGGTGLAFSTISGWPGGRRDELPSRQQNSPDPLADDLPGRERDGYPGGVQPVG
jgi:hypothetical protein